MRSTSRCILLWLGTPHWPGNCAIARASSASAEPTSATFKYLDTEQADSGGDPNVYEAASNIVPDIIQQVFAGNNYKFSSAPFKAHAHHFGYVAWLVLGGDAYAATIHTLTPTDQA